MEMICPHCRNTVEFSQKRPRFCGHCGGGLSTVDFTPENAPTRSAPPRAEALTGDFEAPTASAGAIADGAAARKVPEQIGGYRIGRRLGGGGMGSVYEAEHIASGHKVALKLIKPEYAMSEPAVERFRQEGRLASSITHSRCVFVLAADEEAGQPYIAMELMPGSTLADLVLEKGPLRLADAIARILDVIEGLQEAHRLGVIHRDMKPSNCFLDSEGRVKVGDFGLAKMVAEDDKLTRTGTFIGTPLFSSPEQIKRQPLTPQSDVYSVAATLYFLLTGQAPFSGGDAMAIAARIVSEDAAPVRSLRPEVPRALERVVMRGLARNRDDRWPDLDSFRQALLPFLPGQLSLGSMGPRFGAWVIDWIILQIVQFPLLYFLVKRGPTEYRDPAQLMDQIEEPTLETLLIASTVVVLYFGILEGIWGWSLGKRWLKLRVCRSTEIESPGLARGLLRGGSCFALTHLGTFIFLILLFAFRGGIDASDGFSGKEVLMGLSLGFAQPLGSLLGFGLLLLPMRTRNGYRGLHEFLSETRVVQLPPRTRRHDCDPGTFQLETSHPPDLPARVGPLDVCSAINWLEPEKTVLAEDRSLERKLWVWLRPASAPPLESNRRDLSRTTRLRWVASGTDGPYRWDGFLAPVGVPLPLVIEKYEEFSWSEARPILEQLAEELRLSCEEKTLPEFLSVSQIWLDAHGNMQLIGTPMAQLDKGATATTANDGLTDPQRAVLLLAQSTALLLEGRTRTPDKMYEPISAPVPWYVGAALDPLFNKQKPYSKPEDFQRELESIREKPVEVTRWQRFVQLAILSAVGLLMFTCCFGIFTLFPVSAVPNLLHQESFLLRELDAVSQRDLAIASIQPDPAMRIAGLARYAEDLRLLAELQSFHDHEQARFDDRVKWVNPAVRQGLRQQMELPDDWYRKTIGNHDLRDYTRMTMTIHEGMRDALPWWFPIVSLSVLSGLWFVWSTATRGGLLARALGMELVRNDGRRAGFLQCAYRSLLFWAPIVLLLSLSILLDASYWRNWDDLAWREAERWRLWISFILWWLGMGLLPLYFLRAMWIPAHSLHDRIAGTWLVPR
ncbi:MAG TPA: protein kinase [Gemmataceae bacterium]|jgi:hypothetical protein|nr:protein kinase [Gemmataceae bacterium]